MFASLVSRLLPSTARKASAEFNARKAERERLASLIGTHMARGTHRPDGIPSMLSVTARESRSDNDAHQGLIDACIARDVAKARAVSMAGHRLYKATSRALVAASSKD